VVTRADDRAAHARRALAVVMLVAVAGCGAILGFHEAVPNGDCRSAFDCAPDQRCVNEQCTPLCGRDGECGGGKICQLAPGDDASVCTVPPVVHVSSTLDAGDDDAADGDVDACASGFADCNLSPADGCEANLAWDPDNCGTCGHACASAPCAEGMCRSVVPTGYYRQGATFLSLSPDTIMAWHLPAIPTDGWLWKIGIVLSPSTTPGTPITLALYQDDGSGNPVKLLAQGQVVAGSTDGGATGNTNEVVFSPPLIAIAPPTSYYVAVLSAATPAHVGAVAAAEGSSNVSVFETDYPYGSGSISANVSFPKTVRTLQADVYIVIAQ
jgi:hypothetical protein